MAGMAGSATIRMLFGLVMAVARFIPPLAGFVMALARAITPLVAVVPVVAAIICRLARDLGRVPTVRLRPVTRLGNGGEAEQSHERAENDGIAHCQSSCVPCWPGFGQDGDSMRDGR